MCPPALKLTASSPDIIYDVKDSDGTVELSSLQSPRLASRVGAHQPDSGSAAQQLALYRAPAHVAVETAH